MDPVSIAVALASATAAGVADSVIQRLRDAIRNRLSSTDKTLADADANDPVQRDTLVAALARARADDDQILGAIAAKIQELANQGDSYTTYAPDGKGFYIGPGGKQDNTFN